MDKFCKLFKLKLIIHYLSLLQLSFGCVTFILFYGCNDPNWVLLIMLYANMFTILYLHHAIHLRVIKKMIFIFMLLTIPHWIIVFGTLHMALLEPKRFTYRFNCYYRANYWSTNAENDNRSLLDIVEYHKPTHHSKYVKLFSASLYGSAYTQQYIDNVIRIAQEIHTTYGNEWILRLYADINIETAVMDHIIEMESNIEIVLVNDTNVDSASVTRWNSAGMFWRFLPLTNNSVTFISIDLDEDGLEAQGISTASLDKWLDSNRLFLRTIISDHWPWPKTHVTGKAWGRQACISTKCPIITHQIISNAVKKQFGADEIFIATQIYPIMKAYGLYTVYYDLFAKMFFGLSFQHSQITTYDAQNETFQYR
eukprot:121221_1